MQKSMFVRSGSRYRIAKPVEILEAASYCKARDFEASRPIISEPSVANDFLADQLRHCREEHFCVLFLDNRHRVIAFEKMFRGTIDGAAVHPRDVVREVLDRDAASVILAHNHPSGYAAPSDADLDVTRRLKAALALIDVRVLDHVIVGDSQCYSFAEHGLI